MPKPRLFACLLVGAIVSPLGCTTPQSGSPTNVPEMSNALAPLDVDPALEATPPVAATQPTPPAPASGWPRQLALANATALVYLPQVDGWQGNRLSFRAAVALKTAGSSDATFGVIRGTARTGVDRQTRTVALDDFDLTEARFPTLADQGLAYLPRLRAQLPKVMATMPLDVLQGELAAAGTVSAKAVTVKNEPPRVIVSTTPAILVPVDGSPNIKTVPGSSVERIINTQALIVRTGLAGRWYLHVFDGWLSSTSLDGPWSLANGIPAGLDQLAQRLAKQGVVDLLDGGPQAKPRPSLSSGVPTIYLSQVPAELIVFQGQPNFIPITGTGLLWAENTTADVLVNTANNEYYTLLSGRWYRAPGLSGP